MAIDDSVADLLQRPARDIVGRSYLEFTYQADRFRNVIELSRLHGGGTPHLIRKRYLRADRSPLWVDLKVSHFGHGLDAGRLIGSFHLPGEEREAGSPKAMRDMVRRLLLLERLRAEGFGGLMFADGAWTILLETYLGEAEGRIVDLPTLVERGALPVSAVVRWIKAVQAEGLIETASSSGVAWQLSPEGIRRVEELLVRFAAGQGEAGLSI